MKRKTCVLFDLINLKNSKNIICIIIILNLSKSFSHYEGKLIKRFFTLLEIYYCKFKVTISFSKESIMYKSQIN